MGHSAMNKKANFCADNINSIRKRMGLCKCKSSRHVCVLVGKHYSAQEQGVQQIPEQVQGECITGVLIMVNRDGRQVSV